ncbi:hypothetical protein M426DRAFT_323400, partial [Hypoxylon sp. CI-4A]
MQATSSQKTVGHMADSPGCHMFQEKILSKLKSVNGLPSTGGSIPTSYACVSSHDPLANRSVERSLMLNFETSLRPTPGFNRVDLGRNGHV